MSLLEALNRGAVMSPDRIDAIGLAGYCEGIRMRAPAIGLLDWPMRQEPIHPPHLKRSILPPRLDGFAFRHLGGRRHTYVQEADATLRSRGVSVVHFPYQQYFRTSLPSIYEPWDLQHRHLPQLFSPDEVAWRDLLYAYGCERARYVVVASRWTKDDIVKQYAIDPQRIAVIPRSTSLFERLLQIDPVAERRDIPNGVKFARGSYCIYPALTYPHKNHLKLVEAIARLKRDNPNEVVNFVFTGRTKGEFFKRIQAAVAELGIEENVQFVGSVPEADLECLYLGARLLVFPSLFEGLGLPVLEGIAAGLPICVADSTCLPEIAGRAGVIFDPTDVDAIAEGIRKGLSGADRLRSASLRRRAELSDYRWDHALRCFNAVYTATAGASLDDSEASILSRITGRI